MATTCAINNASGPGTANERTVQWWFKQFRGGDESLEGEERSRQQSEGDKDQCGAITETDPLTTTWEIPEELNVDHSMVVWHLKQSEKVKNSVSGYLVLLLLLLSHFSRVRLCVTSETAAHQAPPSLGFSKQEHWSRLPFHSPMHQSEK